MQILVFTYENVLNLRKSSVYDFITFVKFLKFNMKLCIFETVKLQLSCLTIIDKTIYLIR